MCILFLIAFHDSSKSPYKLVLASNRDEFYKRPTKIAGPWEGHDEIFGGIDNQKKQSNKLA
jgi:uncharacterized protein with NRDE domain